MMMANLMAQVSCYILAAVIGVGVIPAQTVDRKAAFEVASVKSSKSGSGGLTLIQCPAARRTSPEMFRCA